MSENRRMTRIYLIDYSLLGEIPPEYNTDQLSTASYAARRVLGILYGIKYGERLPKIARTKDGKPYFADGPEDAYFSISHTDKYAAVILTDEGECGIDIECEKNAHRAERVEKRFLTAVDFELAPTDSQPDVLVSRLVNPLGTSATCELTVGKERKPFDDVAYPLNGRSLSEMEVNSNLSPLSRWTLLEAALKADGRGFGAYRSAEQIMNAVGARHYLFTDGEERYYLSIAISAK